MNFITKKLKRRKLKRTFNEYGYELKEFAIDSIGKISYAQWLHPFEQPKQITKSNIDFYKKLSRTGGMIIDIGAHTGDTTVPMAVAVGKTGLVLGIEPNPYVFKILEQNAKLNPEHTNIIPLCFAATEMDKLYTFNYSDASFCNGGFLSQIADQKHRHNYTLQVEGKNLQQFLFQYYRLDLSRLHLIKIDAEGYDKDILLTLSRIIKTYKPNLLIECFKKLNLLERGELFDTIQAFGYDLYHLNDFESTLKVKLLEKKNMMDEKHFEMLALPKSQSLDDTI